MDKTSSILVRFFSKRYKKIKLNYNSTALTLWQFSCYTASMNITNWPKRMCAASTLRCSVRSSISATSSRNVIRFNNSKIDEHLKRACEVWTTLLLFFIHNKYSDFAYSSSMEGISLNLRPFKRRIRLTISKFIAFLKF